jgi:hypothetical protein
MRATITVVIQLWQEYKHQCFREDEPDKLIDVAGESRVRITAVEDVAARIDIAMKNLLTTTNKNLPKSIRQSKI